MKTVTVPPLWADAATVQIDTDGTVILCGRVIGRVKKGTHTYSPPMSKGSRIVKYHKQVPEWHGFRPNTPSYQRPEYRGETRQYILQALVRDAVQEND